MRRPPAPVRFVARTHWAVGVAVTASIAVIHFSTRHLPISFSPNAYAITGGLATLYLLTGTLVWFGLWPGRPLSRLCTYFYIMRPGLAHWVGDLMRQPEFKDHFVRPRQGGT